MAGKTCMNAKECGSNIVFDMGSIRWSEQLPEEIMHLFLERLCISDYLHCRQVCRSWRNAVRRATASKCCRPAAELPWLVPDGKYGFNLSNKKIVKGKPKSRLYQTKIWRCCVGSIEGWLIVVKHIDGEHNNISFLNPVSRARVMLPPRSKSIDIEFFYRKVVASTLPTSSQCIVACICWEEKLAFCRPFDKSWAIIDPGTRFSDLEIIERKLYATDHKFMMMFNIIIEDADGSGGGSRLSYRAEWQVPLYPQPYCSRGIDIYPSVVYYLAKDSTSEELFIIILKGTTFATLAGRGNSSNVERRETIEGIRVFKLELIDNGAQWAEVVDLGARILFLSQKSNAFIYVDSSSETKAVLQRNGICFALDDHMGSTLEVFSLTDNSIKPYDISPIKAFLSRSFWITPNPW